LSVSRTGKGISLAFFLILLCLVPCTAQQTGGIDFPVIKQLNPNDTGFKQFITDVQGNRRRLSGPKASAQNAVDNLTIYQYTPRQGDDIFSLAARTNIPYSALASINRLNNPTALETGKPLLLPSCPGIFIPDDIQSDLEKLIRASRLNIEDAVKLNIRIWGTNQTFLFFPGADFSPMERAYFLNSGFHFPLRYFRVTSSFGIRQDPLYGNMSMHRGIDLAAPEGSEVFAAADGTVTAIGSDPVYGNYIIITHTNRWTSFYGHLQKVETVLHTELKSGSLIGRVGTTGQSTGPHLHFELRQDGRALDPAGRLRP